LVAAGLTRNSKNGFGGGGVKRMGIQPSLNKAEIAFQQREEGSDAVGKAHRTGGAK